ncbi:hypothetical protein B7C42_06060 [Nocardia cerradoensis]|uniref:Uncharacterized protein n=1 Tax=Nocardia cerradoensis TaxID=85688 RepID=A0A231GYP2_9NOCA|nr:hypothetical protein B7C42_06060 [Nocardia cerradoensis]
MARPSSPSSWVIGRRASVIAECAARRFAASREKRVSRSSVNCGPDPVRSLAISTTPLGWYSAGIAAIRPSAVARSKYASNSRKDAVSPRCHSDVENLVTAIRTPARRSDDRTFVKLSRERCAVFTSATKARATAFNSGSTAAPVPRKPSTVCSPPCSSSAKTARTDRASSTGTSATNSMAALIVGGRRLGDSAAARVKYLENEKGLARSMYRSSTSRSCCSVNVTSPCISSENSPIRPDRK